MMYRIVRALGTLDRRIVYVGIVAVLSLPFVLKYSLPIYPEQYTRRMYETIERIAEDPVEREKVFIVLHNWGPGTSGENEPQFIVMMRHLLRPRPDGHKLKFVLVCSMWDPVYHDTAIVALEKAKRLEIERARRLGLEKPTWEYGVDYLDFGFANAPVFAPLAHNIIVTPRRFYKTDYVNKRDLMDDASYPLLGSYQDIHDVAAVLTVSAADEARDIAGLIKGKYPHVRVAPATMGIVATDMYPYVKSGQLFGLMNSARGASEYRSLLDVDDPEGRSTTNVENAMSAGKVLLLLLIVLGNVAFLVTRWAERTGRLTTRRGTPREPLPSLPAWFMWGLFGVFVVGFGGSALYEYVQFQQSGAVPRERVAQEDDVAGAEYPAYERVDVEQLEREIRAEAQAADDPIGLEYVELRARAVHTRMVERRIGEFFMVFCTLGVLAFLLGDNRFYRVVEAVIVGGAMGYMLLVVEEILIPRFYQPVMNGITGDSSPANILWILLLLPGALWYFAYSKKYRWLNQLIVACFMGLALGPEFQKQINLVVPQILDSVQPIWPWAPFEGGVVDVWRRTEHLIFVIVLVLSLAYFIFFFRPKSTAGNSVLSLGRIVMMVGFGASFGNTVNTRLSWLAPRIGLLWEEWLGKLLGW